MNLNRIAGKVRAAWQLLMGRIYPSYSQAGEDQLLRYLFDTLGVPKPTYIDVGCSHPFMGNNTYFFYQRGARGIVVEPNRIMAQKIRRFRPRDIILEAGIGVGGLEKSDYYQFDSPFSGWSTFSRENAEEKAAETGIPFSIVQSVPLFDLNQVFEKYFSDGIHLLSIDVEGLDLDILKSIDFNRYRPVVICVESISFSTRRQEVKELAIRDFLESKGYFVYGDTHINTLFCLHDYYKS